jgi:hypothetical protein
VTGSPLSWDDLQPVYRDPAGRGRVTSAIDGASEE